MRAIGLSILMICNYYLDHKTHNKQFSPGVKPPRPIHEVSSENTQNTREHHVLLEIWVSELWIQIMLSGD